MPRLSKWLRERYLQFTGSIAFLPAIIAIMFFMAALGMVYLDASEWGKAIKGRLHWLSLRDADTARSIISAIVAGIISLSVFSFSMVMIILNQTASNLSNRTLDNLIGNRFQQLVLGFYIGSIVFALFLLSTIRDVEQGVYVPALSTYLLIALTIVDIFLFIYFLHYITQSVKYETIIRRISEHTLSAMEKTCTGSTADEPQVPDTGVVLPATESGVLQRVQVKELASFCKKNGWCVSLLYPLGTFLLRGTGYIKLTGEGVATDVDIWKHPVHHYVDLEQGHPADSNYHYGFRQLMEIAVKALSPGINDPGTAVESLQALTSLLQWRMQHHPQSNYYDDEGTLRVVVTVRSIDETITDTLVPVWHYGRNDPIVQKGMHQLLSQLQNHGDSVALRMLLQKIAQSTS